MAAPAAAPATAPAAAGPAWPPAPVGGCAAGGEPAASTLIPAMRAPLTAEPMATACLGWASKATGRPNVDESSSATVGIRDEPPTNNTLETSVVERLAE